MREAGYRITADCSAPLKTYESCMKIADSSCAAQPEASIATPIGIESAWIMNGTCGPKSGYRLIAISPAVGGAAGWAGDMVQWRAPPEIDVKLAAAPARRRGRPPSGRTLVPFRRGSEPRRQPNQAN